MLRKLMKKLRKGVQEEENEKEPIAVSICVVNKPDTSS